LGPSPIGLGGYNIQWNSKLNEISTQVKHNQHVQQEQSDNPKISIFQTTNSSSIAWDSHGHLRNQIQTVPFENWREQEKENNLCPASGPYTLRPQGINEP